MSKYLKKAPGSLEAMADQSNLPMEEVFMSVENIILMDCSSSMDTRDCEGNQTRWQVAKIELETLQKQLPGKIALICFNNEPVFCPTGIPVKASGGTQLYDALKYIEPADGTDIGFYLISDGEPFSENTCIELAKKFETPINCIFVGSKHESYSGMEFLNKLAAATRGKAVRSEETGSFQKEFLALKEGN